MLTLSVHTYIHMYDRCMILYPYIDLCEYVRIYIYTYRERDMLCYMYIKQLCYTYILYVPNTYIYIYIWYTYSIYMHAIMIRFIEIHFVSC